MDKLNSDHSTEDKILEAAKNVFVTKGMSGARMQDIANEAGINKALLHYYFRSKEKLFEVIFKAAVSRLVPRITAILESDMPLFIKIERFCENYIETVMQSPFIPLFVINEMNKQPEEFILKIWGDQRPGLKSFFKQVEVDIANGLIKPIHPHQLLVNIVSLIVFPFVAKPIIFFVTGMDSKEYKDFMIARKKEIPEFIINAIKI
jgi:AcrR family transcriptional regulator